MNKLARFNSFGLEEGEEDKQQGLDETTDNAEPPKDNAEEQTDPTATETPTDGEGGEETSETEETSDDDLEIKEDDSEEVAEEKEKKIKIEIEIAQENICEMCDAVASLEDICKQMKDSLQRGGLNVQGRMIAKTSVEHIAKQFKVSTETKSSLESYGYQLDDFNATKISIENFKETILKMIKWIKDKITALLDFIFKRGTVKKLEEELEKTKNEMQDIKDELTDKDAALDKINRKYEREKKHLTDLIDSLNESGFIERYEMRKKENEYKDKIQELTEKNKKDIERLDKKFIQYTSKGKSRYENGVHDYVVKILRPGNAGKIISLGYSQFFREGFEGLQKALRMVEEDKSWLIVEYEDEDNQWTGNIEIESEKEDTFLNIYDETYKLISQNENKFKEFQNHMEKLLNDERKTLGKMESNVDENLDKEKIDLVKNNIKAINMIYHSFDQYNAAIGSFLHVRLFQYKQ